MTQEEILDYNKLCAEFLNLHRDEEVAIYKFNAYPYEYLRFNSDWNWIHEVVEAIENKGYDVFINGLYCRITDSGMTDFEIESGAATTKQEAVVQAINQFLIWYNENN